MAILGQEGGSRTGNPLIDHYLGGFAAAGGVANAAQGQQPVSPFDKYRTYFYAPDPTRREIQSMYAPMRPTASRWGPKPPPKSIRAPGSARSRAEIPAHMLREDNRKIRRNVDDKISARNKDRRRLESLARKAGLIGPDFLPSELDSIWQQAINEAEASSTFGKQVTPWEILTRWSKDPVTTRKYAQPGASAPDLEELVPPEKRTVVQKHTNVQLTDAKTAKAVILSGLRSILGRKPKPNEIRQFRQYLQSLEKKNPTVTTTTSEYEGGDLISSDSQTTGGAPTPSAAFETFADEEFSEEAYAYRIAAEGDEILRAITGSIV